jgi:pSer/pThr/pTyr-binding forkhead associated (FHA) protein
MKTQTLRIGRKPDNDIVLDDPSVSGYHATVSLQSTKEWLLEDNDSTNGTFIDDLRIRKGVINSKSQVKVGKIIVELGKIFRFNKSADDFKEEFQALQPVWEEIELHRTKIAEKQKNVDFIQAIPYVGRLAVVVFEDQFQLTKHQNLLKESLRKWACPKCQQPLRDYDWLTWDDCERMRTCLRCKAKWF